MTKTAIKAICVLMGLACLLSLFYAHRVKISSAAYIGALGKAEAELSAAKEASEAMREEFVVLREEVRKKDVAIRAKKEKEIRALSAVELADRHLAALARFRGVADDQAGAEGLGSP